MDTETLAATPVGQFVIRGLGAVMESRVRYRLFPPDKVLQGADILPGQTVLEIGCGTGFYTIPGAALVGEAGEWIAMDVVPEAVELVSGKVRAAGLTNVRVVKGDARATALDDAGVDTVVLFGVIPAPMLPLGQLLPELHRVLKSGGTLAVWPPVPVYLPESVLASGLFAWSSRRNAVYNFARR
jgi:ubiquinone/menaquinone biosynthesis C-methylase UbiE